MLKLCSRKRSEEMRFLVGLTLFVALGWLNAGWSELHSETTMTRVDAPATVLYQVSLVSPTFSDTQLESPVSFLMSPLCSTYEACSKMDTKSRKTHKALCAVRVPIQHGFSELSDINPYEVKEIYGIATRLAFLNRFNI